MIQLVLWTIRQQSCTWEQICTFESFGISGQKFRRHKFVPGYRIVTKPVVLCLRWRKGQARQPLLSADNTQVMWWVRQSHKLLYLSKGITHILTWITVFAKVIITLPVSFFPYDPRPPSWIPSLPAILTPVLRMCHLFKTTYATLGTCLTLSIDPIWWGNFLRRGNPLKGGQTLGAQFRVCQV